MSDPATVEDMELAADYVETLQTLASDRARDLAWDEQTDAGDAARGLADALAAYLGEGR